MSLEGTRSDARYCSPAHRREGYRVEHRPLAARDAAATSLLLRQTRALADREAAAVWGDAVARSTADAELREIASHVRRLFGA
ncbi:hypothetical protein DEI93_09485 [Curtobacterium sp. MCBD17_035]|uniref:hypothetical protein n=1 Tax=Curtobacterium sp. MCBD17_035 TaxID=2175673 RepID=UPI000DA8DCA8|nr:hypothetical protein [Curtobacterium sp. MCBD17_035]WIB66226.1 hypothetical protein DEI93_09485 [Curtobacterium sp. MCBD17_035]